MGDVFDVVRFFEDMTELIEPPAGSESGLVTLRNVAELGRWTLHADGVAFVEFGPAVGRVISANGSARPALGRRVESADPRIRALLEAGRIGHGTVDGLPEDLTEGVEGSGWFLIGRVGIGPRIIGALVAYLPDEASVLDPAHRAILTFLVSALGRIYRDSPGLPLHADPGVRAPADSTVLLDVDGMVCWMNPRTAPLLDAASVALGAPLPLPMPGPGQVLEHSLADGRWLQITAKHLPDDAGYSLTIRDITEARRWEQSRELFVALTSHELRTPVTVIKGYADTLTDRWDVLDDQGRRHAAHVLGLRAGDLARLLDRLLSVVGEPGIPPVVSRFDLGDAVRGAVDSLPEDLRGQLRIAMPDDMPPVFGEQGSIASVVSELVTNAGKYTPAGSGKIDLDGDVDDRTVGFRVSDRGIGVRPEHVERAFERFWQADTGDHRRFGGVGLGLYLVRRIVERQNGWISLRPRESGGTVAEVRLPRGDMKSR